MTQKQLTTTVPRDDVKESAMAVKFVLYCW